MSTFENVLIVTDLSENSNSAISYGYALLQNGGTVHLVHLIEHELQPGPLYAHYSPDELNLPEKRAEVSENVLAHLKGLIPAEAAQRDIRTELGCAFHGDIAKGIVKEARERNVQAITLGSHGRQGLASLLMGSVAEEVMRTAHLPILVVPKQG